MATKKKPTAKLAGGKKLTRAEALKMLAAIFGGDDEDDEQSKADEQRAEREIRDEATKQAKEPHFWITPIRMQGDTEDTVFVGAAGVNYLMKKGVKVPVPISVINALKLAKVEGFVPIVDEESGQKRQVRVSYDRYPFQNDGPASAEDVAKWRAEQARKAKRRSNLVEDEQPEEEVMGRPQIEFGPTAPVIEG